MSAGLELTTATRRQSALTTLGATPVNAKAGILVMDGLAEVRIKYGTHKLYATDTSPPSSLRNDLGTNQGHHFYVYVADINECAEGSDNCHQNAYCINNAGSYSCTCWAGYTGDGVTCTAIQQEEPTDPCGKII